MKQLTLARALARRGGILAAAVAVVGMASASASAAVVFQDTFGAGSSLNPASYPTPTSTSTGYTVASTKNSTSSLASGDLKLAMAATTSGIVQTQAKFPAVSLAAAGDFVQMTTVFTATNNMLAGGTSSFLYQGLFNSGGFNPATGLASSGLNTTAGSAFATGNAANWQGYVARFAQNTANNLVYTRPLQNGAGTSSANQDLVGNNAGGGTYNNPVGVQVGGGTTSTLAALTNASTYTSDMIITLNGDGTANITSALYSGNTATGTPLATQTVVAPATLLATSFDSLTLGYRQSGTSVATQIDYNSITISTNDVPEPTALALVGSAVAFGLRRRRA